MARSLILGNGNILVGLDEDGQLRDFYFPHVGLENHVGGHNRHRLGVWVDGRFSWVTRHGWDIKITCQASALIGEFEAVNRELGLSIFGNDAVYNEKNIYLRKLIIRNDHGIEREIRIYFGHEFQIYESRRGDTAYYDPIHRAIIHYKGRRIFLVNAFSDKTYFDDFTTGVFGIESKEGSFKDAEDGELSRNPIEHGQSDSVISISLKLKAGEEKTVHYWMCVAESVKEVHELNHYVLERGPEHLLHTTHDFWRAWISKYKFNFKGLSRGITDLFNKSLFYIRSNVDGGGAIIASGDTGIFHSGKDTYAYMWPRDAAFAAMALDKAGDPDVARRFFQFCNNIITEEGYFMHKYRPDRSLGSSWHPWLRDGQVQLPIQEDETALVLFSLWKHYELSRDLEFIEGLYNSLIKKAASFIMSHRDSKTGLPKPSYDLWEESFGVHTFTAAACYGALVAAAKFAKLLGKELSQHNYQNAADEMKRAILKYLYDEKSGIFLKSLKVEKGEWRADATVDISAPYGIFLFGVLRADDEHLKMAMQNSEAALSAGTNVGGIARYQSDNYYRVDSQLAGNPWVITTLWLSQYYIGLAKEEKDFEPAKKWLAWAAKHALPSGVLSEQIHPYTGEQISAAPLTWSHAEFVLTVIRYLDKLDELGLCVTCNPVK